MAEETTQIETMPTTVAELQQELHNQTPDQEIAALKAQIRAMKEVSAAGLRLGETVIYEQSLEEREKMAGAGFGGVVPCAAIITYIHPDKSVNLLLFSPYSTIVLFRGLVKFGFEPGQFHF